MKCAQVREDYGAYLSGEAENPRMIEDHLSGCPACQKEMAQLKKVCGAMRDAERVMPSSDFYQKIYASTIDSPNRQSRRIGSIRKRSGMSLWERITSEWSARIRGMSLAYAVVVHVLLVCLLFYFFHTEFKQPDTPVQVRVNSTTRYNERCGCTDVYTIDLRNNTIDLSPYTSRSGIYVSRADRNCLMLFEEKPKGFSESRRELKDGSLVLEKDEREVFNGDKTLKVFVFDNRIEVWSSRQWFKYKNMLNDIPIQIHPS